MIDIVRTKNTGIGELRNKVWVQVEADGEEFWGALLDRLSELLTPQEEAAVRQVAGDKGSPSNTRELHIHVAGLLVKHGLTTWDLLHTTFPGAQSMSAFCGLVLLTDTLCH